MVCSKGHRALIIQQFPLLMQMVVKKAEKTELKRDGAQETLFEDYFVI